MHNRLRTPQPPSLTWLMKTVFWGGRALLLVLMSYPTMDIQIIVFVQSVLSRSLDFQSGSVLWI